jgi:hypothetical protein
MQKPRRPSPESIVIMSAVAVIGAVGAWAAGAWNDTTPAQRQTVAEAMPAPAPGQGVAPESDTRADMPDVCSRRVGCLLR